MHKTDGGINNKHIKNNILVYNIVNNEVYNEKYNTYILLICNQ